MHTDSYGTGNVGLESPLEACSLLCSLQTQIPPPAGLMKLSVKVFTPYKLLLADAGFWGGGLLFWKLVSALRSLRSQARRGSTSSCFLMFCQLLDRLHRWSLANLKDLSSVPVSLFNPASVYNSTATERATDSSPEWCEQGSAFLPHTPGPLPASALDTFGSEPHRSVPQVEEKRSSTSLFFSASK